MESNNEKISIVARELDEKGVLKTYASYIPSFITSYLIEFLATAIDRWILAHILGAVALGVTSRVLPMCYLIVLAISLFDGFNIYISHSFGENNLRKVNSLFTLSFYLLLILTAISTILYCYSPTILALLEGSKCSSYLLELGQQYLRGVAWGLFPMIALSAFSYMVRIDGSKYLPIYASSTVVICNIILDFILIGKFRYYGAGIATSISYWVGFVILSVHFFKKTNTYKLLATLNFSDVSFKKLVSLTCPNLAHHAAKFCKVSILTFLGFSGFGIVFGMISSIYNTAEDFIWIALNGVIEAARPLIGVAYGRKDYKTLRDILHAMYKLVFLFDGFLCLFFFIFPQTFPLLMNLHPDDEAFAPACTAIRLLTIVAMINAINYIYNKYYQQVGHEKFIAVLNLLRSTVFVIPFYFLFAHFKNVNGFWLSNICRESILLIILLAFHLWQSHKLKDKYLGA